MVDVVFAVRILWDTPLVVIGTIVQAGPELNIPDVKVIVHLPTAGRVTLAIQEPD